MATLQLLVIHCTATPGGREVTAADIRRWHLSPPPAGRGWHQVGYTELVHLDGRVERLVQNNEDSQVDPWEVTNGATGFNQIARHIVYAGGIGVGGKPSDTRTPAQKDALRSYVHSFLQSHPQCKVAGHNQLAPKACPSFDVPQWLRSIGVNPQNIY